MPHGHSQIHGRDEEHDKGEDHQKELRRQNQHIRVLHNPPEDIPPERKLNQVRQIQGEHERGREARHNPAARPGDHAADQLGQNQLPGPDRERVHEVALVPQQPLGKAVDHKDDGDDEHGHNDAYKGEHEQTVFAQDGVVCILKQGESVDQSQGQRRPPDQGKLLPHGSEVVFQETP